MSGPRQRNPQPRTKEQWREFRDRANPPRPAPGDIPSRAEYSRWELERRGAFDQMRYRCHANPPITVTPQMTNIQKALAPKLTQGSYAEDGAYEGAVFNGPAYCGKTSLLKMIGKQYELNARAAHPDLADGDRLGDWVPVVFVSASTGATAGMLSATIGKFLHVPSPARGGNKWTLTDPVLDALAAVGTELLLIDDLHMLDKHRDGGQETNDHVKTLANSAAVTIIGAGILLERGNLFTDGRPSPPDAGGKHTRGRAAQFGARYSDMQQLAPFTITTRQEQKVWMALVKHFETNLILLDHPPNSLTLTHWRYLHERTSGYIGALASLFKQGAHEAVDSGAEHLDPDVLDRVMLGHDAEADYATLKTRRQAADKRRARQADAPAAPPGAAAG